MKKVSDFWEDKMDFSSSPRKPDFLLVPEYSTALSQHLCPQPSTSCGRSSLEQLNSVFKLPGSHERALATGWSSLPSHPQSCLKFLPGKFRISVPDYVLPYSTFVYSLLAGVGCTQFKSFVTKSRIHFFVSYLAFT